MAFNRAKALQEAERSVSQRKFSQAIQQYLEIAEQDPSDVTLLNTIGDLLVREGNLSQALVMFHRLADTYFREGFYVRAIAIYRKIVKFEPDSIDSALRLAELYATQKLTHEARTQYALAFELCQSQDQSERAAETLRQIVALDPESIVSRIRLAEHCEQLGRRSEAAQEYLKTARVRLAHGEAAAAGAALRKAVEVDASNHEAGKIALEILRADPGDLASLTSFSVVCCDKGNPDLAVEPLAAVVDELLDQKRCEPLMDALQCIRNQHPQHLPTLELMCRIYERTADDSMHREVLEALGLAYFEAGRLEQAESAYHKLVERNPNDAHCLALLDQILERRGKKEEEPGTLAAVRGAAEAMSFTDVDAEQITSVAEALGTSDLYSRYGLPDRALAELEKVIVLYPDRIELYQRIFEISQRDRPAGAARAAAELARIHRQRGSLDQASSYEDLQRRYAALAPALGPTSASSGGTDESGPTPSFQSGAEHAHGNGMEWDLTGELDVLASVAGTPSSETDLQLFNYEESKGEIDFYLDSGFIEEARAAVLGLLEKFPANTQVEELRRRVANKAHGVNNVADASVSSSKQDGMLLPPREPASVVPSGREAKFGISGKASRSALSPTLTQLAPGVGRAGGDTSLHSLLDELGETELPDAGAADPELHYNLGVAYHEMELLDEAIGEFQKAVKAAGKGRFPARHLETCSLLASCFTGKGMPLIAAKWYQRALESPNLDEDARLALQYHLGLAFQQAGNAKTALEHFLEVYSQNIDYLDVAERVRQLQLKPT
jgi:tetratricopeptide (TPR) repeat protein